MPSHRLLSQQIRDAVEASGRSRYSICQETGIDKGSMSRFMAGQVGLSMDALDAIGRVLRLELKAVRAAKRK